MVGLHFGRFLHDFYGWAAFWAIFASTQSGHPGTDGSTGKAR
jgi:hypothetical protein